MLNDVVDISMYAQFERRMLSEFRSDPQNHDIPLYHERKYYYDYLYLDPRVLRTMEKYEEPRLEELLNFWIFVQSIFYIGKGMGNRAMAHLHETRRIVEAEEHMDIDQIQRGQYQYDTLLHILRNGRHLYQDHVSNLYSYVLC